MIPLILSFVSISKENLEIFFIIAIFQSIEFSRSYLSKPTDQFLEYDLFNNLYVDHILLIHFLKSSSLFFVVLDLSEYLYLSPDYKLFHMKKFQ